MERLLNSIEPVQLLLEQSRIYEGIFLIFLNSKCSMLVKYSRWKKISYKISVIDLEFSRIFMSRYDDESF